MLLQLLASSQSASITCKCMSRTWKPTNDRSVCSFWRNGENVLDHLDTLHIRANLLRYLHCARYYK